MCQANWFYEQSLEIKEVRTAIHKKYESPLYFGYRNKMGDNSSNRRVMSGLFTKLKGSNK